MFSFWSPIGMLAAFEQRGWESFDLKEILQTVDCAGKQTGKNKLLQQ